MHSLVPVLLVMSGMSLGRATDHVGPEDCLKYSDQLENPGKRTYFYVRGDKGFQKVLITVKGPREKEITLEREDFPEDFTWTKVAITTNEIFLKVTIDGEEVKQIHSRKYYSPVATLKSVKLVGKGLMTWCDPKPEACDGGSEKYWRSVVIATSIIILILSMVIFAMAFFILRSRKSRYAGAPDLPPFPVIHYSG